MMRGEEHQDICDYAEEERHISKAETGETLQLLPGFFISRSLQRLAPAAGHERPVKLE